MDDEKLIDCVRQHVVLYDLSDPKYMDLHVKSDIWAKIGAQMNMEGSACKARWYNIRDTFRKSLKRSVTKRERGAKKVKAYKYARQLGFLMKHVEESIGQEELRDDELNSEIMCDDQVYEYEEMEDSAQEHLDQCAITSQTPIPPEKQTLKAVDTKKVNPVVEIASPNFMDYLMSKNKGLTVEQHPVDAFLNAMAPTLKNLSPYDWHLAKSEIFNTVQRFEMKNIMGHQNSFNT